MDALEAAAPTGVDDTILQAMGRILVQVAMALAFAGSAAGLTQEAMFHSGIERPDYDTHEPADRPEPCDEQSSFCDEEPSDNDAAKPLAGGHVRLLVASRASWRDGRVPKGHPPTPLFRPPIG